MDTGKDNEKPSNIILEVKTEKDITPEDIADLTRFTENHVNSYIEYEKQFGLNKEADEKGAAAFVHRYALKSINRAKDNNLQLSVIFAKDASGLVGYSIVEINPNKEDSEKVEKVFIGVANDKQSQGIGTKILQERIRILKGMGITQYESMVADEAVALYDKLGIRYDARPHPTNDKAQSLTVYL